MFPSEEMKVGKAVFKAVLPTFFAPESGLLQLQILIKPLKKWKSPLDNFREMRYSQGKKKFNVCVTFPT